MKLNFLATLMLSASIIFYSCDSEDSSNLISGNQEIATDQNAEEDTKIPVTNLAAGIEVTGATKETGTPPASNSTMDFQIDSNQQEAFQSSGLSIRFSSSNAVSGAFIQFKDVDGNATDSYFNVPATSFNSALSKNSWANKLPAQNTDFENEINVDFGDEITAGEFCYDICLYDEQENVSQVIEVCATVEAWGGNAEVVGEWVLDRFEPDNRSDEKITIQCVDGQSITVDYELIATQNMDLTINQDGTYIAEFDDEYQDIDYEASAASCSATYNEAEEGAGKSTGNWAYNEDAETLTVVEFKYEDLINPEETEIYEDGYLVFASIGVELIGNQLIMTDTEGDEVVKIYFTRK